MGARHKISSQASTRTLVDELNSIEGKSRQQIKGFLTLFNSGVKFEDEVQEQLMGKARVTRSMVELYMSRNFNKLQQQIWEIFTEISRGFLKKKLMLMITEQEWRFLYVVSQFLLLISDSTTIEAINQYIEGSEANRLQEQEQLQPRVAFLGAVRENKQQLYSLLRDVLYCTLEMKSKIYNSTLNFTMVFSTMQCIFCFYAELSDSQNILQDMRHSLKIGAYMLGLGIHNDNQTCIDLAVDFLTLAFRNLPKQPLSPAIRPIPGNYFPSMPIFTHSTFFQQLCTYLLYAISRLKTSNLTPISALLRLIYQHQTPNNQQIPYFLDLLCDAPTKSFTFTLFTKSLVQEYTELCKNSTSSIARFIAQAQSISEQNLKMGKVSKVSHFAMESEQGMQDQIMKGSVREWQEGQVYVASMKEHHHSLVVGKFLQGITRQVQRDRELEIKEYEKSSKDENVHSTDQPHESSLSEIKNKPTSKRSQGLSHQQ